MATSKATNDPANGTDKTPTRKRKAASESLAPANQTAEGKHTVNTVQQQQRSDPERFAAMAEHYADLRARMVAEAAYYRAQVRNFEPGRELDDWLDAEAEVDRRTAAGRVPGAGHLTGAGDR